MKAKEALYQLSLSQEYQEFLILYNAAEEREIVKAAAIKLFRKFVDMINPTISSIRGCTRIKGNEAKTKAVFSERVRTFKKAARKYCAKYMPEYSQYFDECLDSTFSYLWKPKNNKR